jgi:predicted acylesterase/phospholipase RssA
MAPERCCDLVMKGGITSGVLYPSAVREIAERFYLVGIGGTSAGAIAASVAAAAEYRRRQTGSFEGFERFEEIARELAAPGRLLGLFRPDAPTGRLFEVVQRFLEGRAGVLTKLGIGWWLLVGRDRRLARIVDNGFGLATGMANDNRKAGEPPLTEWLADTIDEVAGMPPGEPLTFAHLREARVPDTLTGVVDRDHDASIDLRAITTCLTFGRPFEIPFEQDIFAFDPVAWRRLFPERIVAHLARTADTRRASTLARDGRLPLPRLELPVVVAARMSLSFPGLFSMIPLDAVNWGRPDEPLQRVWFSDGGITSNFPIHRFDALYPRWPTLGLNLQYTGPDGQPARRRLQREGGRVFVARDRREGVLDLWHDFERAGTATGDMLGFAAAIFRAAQVWHDNAYLKLPGYRDRVAEIWLSPDEGGLNLDMDAATIERLIERGREAGRTIAERFSTVSGTEPMSWDGHRWTRFRSAMAGLMHALRRLERNAAVAMPGDATLAELLADRDRPPSYPFDTLDQAQAARLATDDLLELVAAMRELGVCLGSDDDLERPFCAGPRPRVEIGSRAPF